MLNGTGPLKLYGNLAIVMTTSNKLVAEPRQVYMYEPFHLYLQLEDYTPSSEQDLVSEKMKANGSSKEKKA